MNKSYSPRALPADFGWLLCYSQFSLLHHQSPMDPGRPQVLCLLDTLDHLTMIFCDNRSEEKKSTDSDVLVITLDGISAC